MSSTHSESVAGDDATASQSQIAPSSTVAISTANVLGDPINQVFFSYKSIRWFCHFSLSFVMSL